MRRTDLFRAVVSAMILLFVTSNLWSQNGVIKGKVTFGKEALQSATISVEKKTTLTNDNGEFSLSVPPGSYKLIITHVGYKKIERVITVDSANTKIFEFDMSLAEQLGDIVVLGSRSLVQRSNLNTAVPVDAFSSAQLHQTGQTGLVQMLNFTAPSLNTSLQNAYEPVTLRGLYPDQTLILLNGTRLSSSAFINNGNPRGILGRGSVTNDLNSIPFSAIEKVEILRDGASAQYGSDAVAGVVNIVLKESASKTSVNLHLGQYYKGDGETISLGIYHQISLSKKGLPAGRQGFLNLAGDFRYRNPTFRGGEFKGTVYKNYRRGATPADSIQTKAQDDSIVSARGFDRMKVSNAGNSKLTSFGILMNGAYPTDEKTKIFWTGAVSNSSFDFAFPHIFPKAATRVNTVLFPDGFKGRVIPDNWNVLGIGGVKGVMGKGTHWEYSSAYAMNSSRLESKNTNNASQQFTLGQNAPTEFYTGTLIYQQLTNTIHFTKNIVAAGKNLRSFNLHWGAEFRLENFKMKAGEESSWNDYDSLARKLGGAQVGLIVSPSDVVNEKRNVAAAYIDFETEIKDRLLIDLAGRFEHYSDFGNNFAGKLAARYQLNNEIAIRASLGNGFRAPSMQQRYWGTIYSGFIGGSINSGNSATPITSGVFNNEHQVTKVFGVPPLEAEKSLNVSVGATATITQNIYLTIDGYWIQVKNRVVLGGAFDRTNPEVDSLLRDPSLANYAAVFQVSFFSNAINTRTEGIDAVVHGQWNFEKAQFTAILSANFTRTHLFGDIKTAANLSSTTENENTLFNEEHQIYLEEGQPRSKIILSLNYKKEKIGFMLRNTRFGETAYKPVDNPKESFSPKILTDFSSSYAPKSWLTITVGANNIFDVYPDRIENYQSTSEGIFIYATQASPFGYNGGYYYVSTIFNF
jgi:iron complex outermembrane receptor protein